MSFRSFFSRVLPRLMSLGLFCISIEAVQAQQLQYSSLHRNGERPLAQTLSGGSSELREQMNANRSAVSVAVGDLDRDGTVDLVTGYVVGTGGALTVQRGNPAATAPSGEDWVAYTQGRRPQPFAAAAQIVSLPVRPDLLITADINGDGAIDVLVAARGDSSAYLLLGNGKGGFLSAKAVPLGGSVSTLNTLRTGDATHLLAAGVCDTARCSLQLLKADGTVTAAMVLPGNPTSIYVGSLTGGGLDDLAVAAGGSVLLFNGTDAAAGKITVETLPVQGAVAIASGNFTYDRRGFGQIAVLDANGTMHILARSGLDDTVPTLEQAKALAHIAFRPDAPKRQTVKPAGMAWSEVETLSHIGPAVSADSTPILLRGHMAASGTDDVAIAGAGQFVTVAHVHTNTGLHQQAMARVSEDTTGAPVLSAALARLTPDARMGTITVDGGAQPLITLPPTNKTFTVNTFTDGAPAANCNTTCSLRTAVSLANADAVANGTSKVDEIDIPAGTYTLTYSAGNDVDGNLGYHMNVNASVNLVGAGAATTIINANHLDKIFTFNYSTTTPNNGASSSVGGNYEIFLSGLTLENGTNNNDYYVTSTVDNYGGLADWWYYGAGFLTFNNCVLTGGTAKWGAGGALVAGNYSTSSGSGLEIDNSTLSSNGTPEFGGALAIGSDVPLILTNDIFSSNNATYATNSSDPGYLGQGGALDIVSSGNTTSSQITITGTTFSSNTARGDTTTTGDAGGAYIAEPFTMSGSTFTSNTAPQFGGALEVSLPRTGSSITNSTFTGNSATSGTSYGGAIAMDASSPSANNVLSLSYSRIHGNTANTNKGIEVLGGAGVGGTITATNNWWGCNGAATGTNCDTSAAVGANATLTASPYTTLIVTPSSTTPTGPGSFSATASMAQNSSSTAYTGSQDNALSGVAATLVITQPDATATSSGATALSSTDTITTTATPDTNKVDYGAGTMVATVDGFSVTANFTLLESDLTVASSHTGTFVAGSTGNTYTLTVNNIGNSASSTTVTVVDTLPSGFTATAMTGSGWACILGTLTCTRSDTLNASSSYPVITLTVTAATAAGSYSNSVLVSGGTELYSGNNTGGDSTSVIAGAATKFTVTGLGPFTAPGSAGTATVIAVDNFNNTATTFTGTVAITSNDADATLPANYTYVLADGGVHNFSVTLNTAGTFSVTATATVGGYTGSETGIIVQDSVWLLNSNLQLVQTSSAGAKTNQTSVTATASTLGAVAFDNTGNLWAVGNANNNVYEFGHTGTTISSGTSGGGINTPTAIAIDGLGNAWIANGNNTVTEFTNSRTAVTPATGYLSGSGKLNTPTGLIIDNAGSIWITNSGNNTVTKIIGGAAPVVTPAVTGTTNNTLGTRP